MPGFEGVIPATNWGLASVNPLEQPRPNMFLNGKLATAKLTPADLEIFERMCAELNSSSGSSLSLALNTALCTHSAGPRAFCDFIERLVAVTPLYEPGRSPEDYTQTWALTALYLTSIRCGYWQERLRHAYSMMGPNEFPRASKAGLSVSEIVSHVGVDPSSATTTQRRWTSQDLEQRRSILHAQHKQQSPPYQVLHALDTLVRITATVLGPQSDLQALLNSYDGWTTAHRD